MKPRKQPLIGLCPIGKFVFSHEDAMRMKHGIFEKFDQWKIEYVNLDNIIPDGMVRDQKHVEPVVRYFQDQRIDALFIPHCNFGTEGAAAMIAKQCAVPTLLWTPRDEADLYAAISSVLLEAASSYGGPSFIPDITIRHPDNNNAVLLWHTDAPLSLRHPDSYVKVDLPWILRGLPTGLVHFKLKDGPLTICRFAGDGDDGYRLGCGEGRTVDWPYTQEFCTWLEVDDWPVWERQLIHGPYIHHCSCCYEHSADVLEEAMRFIPHLKFERFGKS